MAAIWACRPIRTHALLPLSLRSPMTAPGDFRSPSRRSAAPPSKPCRPTPRPAASIPTTGAPFRSPNARLRQCAGAGHAGQRRRDGLVEYLPGQGRAGLHAGANGTFLSGITRSRTSRCSPRRIPKTEKTCGPRFPLCRRDNLVRKTLQDRAGDPHRGPQPPAGSWPERRGNSIGSGAFEDRWTRATNRKRLKRVGELPQADRTYLSGQDAESTKKEYYHGFRTALFAL